MADLKKCPFCGGEARYMNILEGVFVSRFVTCTKCGIETRRNYFRKSQAEKAWNNRATEAELRANVIEEFAEAIMVKATELSEKVVFDGRLVCDALSLDCVSDMVMEIASQMKGEKE